MRCPDHRYFPGQTYKFGNRREAFATCLRPWLLRRLAGIAQHEQSPLVVVHEDVAAGVDGELLAPVDLRCMPPERPNMPAQSGAHASEINWSEELAVDARGNIFMNDDKWGLFVLRYTGEAPK